MNGTGGERGGRKKDYSGERKREINGSHFIRLTLVSTPCGAGMFFLHLNVFPTFRRNLWSIGLPRELNLLTSCKRWSILEKVRPILRQFIFLQLGRDQFQKYARSSKSLIYIFIRDAYNIAFGKTYCSLRINIVGCKGSFYEGETWDSLYASISLCKGKVENLININRRLYVNEIVGTSYGELFQRPGK